MINILLEGYNITEPYLYDELKQIIKSEHRVAVIALSFRDTRVRSLSDWNLLYCKDSGRFYGGIVGGLAEYGISEDNISFINYFTDTKVSAKEKVKNADILYFLGGLPDRMAERIEELGLREALMKHEGIVMGYSAGAVIQLEEYHLSPDHDYPEFGYYPGLPYLKDFYLEVHYEGTEAQNNAIARVLSERKKTVYATSLMSGAIIIFNGKIKTLGDVKIFTYDNLIKSVRTKAYSGDGSAQYDLAEYCESVNDIEQSHFWYRKAALQDHDLAIEKCRKLGIDLNPPKPSRSELQCRIYPLGYLERYRFTVICANYRGKWILSKHKKRDTWETQGGHIEAGEDPIECARRELFEESGIKDADIYPVCDYWGFNSQECSNGMVFLAVVHSLGELPESEMKEIGVFDELPYNLTYPQVSPRLYEEAQKLLRTL